MQVEHELNPLLAGVFHLPLGARHVLLVAAIGADHLGGSLTDGGTHAVHGGIATAQHHHLLAGEVDVVGLCLLEAQQAVGVGDEVGQGIIDARCLFVGKATLHVLVGTDPEEDRIELAEQVGEGDVLAHFGLETKLHAHPLEDLAATLHHLFFQLEGGDAKGEQAADLRILVKHHRGDAIACQHVGTGETRRAGADDGDPLAGLDHVREIGLPAHLERLVGDVLFDIADGHRAEAIVEGAGALAEAILRADPTAHFRQAVGLVG